MGAATAAPPAPSLGSLAIDVQARSARVEGSELYLSEPEFRLLAALAKDPHRTLTYEELVSDVFDRRPAVGRRLVDAAAARLRRKLELRGAGALIASYPGVGFRLFERAEPEHRAADGRDDEEIGGAR